MKTSIFQKTIVLLLIVSILFMITGCYNITPLTVYEQNLVTKKRKEMINVTDRGIALPIDGEEKSSWLLSDVSFDDTALTALHAEKVKNPFLYYDEIVFIYLKKDSRIYPREGELIQIPLDKIEKLELKEFNGLKTLSCIVGIPAAAVGLFIFILIATKESCPFVYAYADGEYVFRGEIFSGAVFPSEERDDYLLIPGITGIEGEYRIKIINKIRNEDQYNNLAELILYDHPPDVSIIVDKYGNPHTIKNPVSPSNAKNRYEQEIRPSLVSKNDDIIYQSGIVNKTDLKDEIICTFPRPQGKEKAKLVIRAKNTFWLDYVYKEFFYQLGDYYPQWYENRMKKKENDFELNKARGFFLSVYIKNSGEWHYADSFPLVGPVAFRDDALELDLSHIPCPDDILTIKLEAGMNFWEIDYLALDYSDNMPLTGTVVPLAGAVNQSGEDVSSMLKEKDTSYYFQPDYNDQALIRFPVPPAIPGLQRTVVLHTCGYYLIDIGPAPRGKPRKKDLLKLKDPDEFLKFSNWLYLSITGGE